MRHAGRRLQVNNLVVIGHRDLRKVLVDDSYEIIDTTSHSKTWSVDLSPFYLGPVHLYQDRFAHNVENAWQYSKVYNEHLNSSGTPNEAWFKFATDGFLKQRASRYPMGKGAIPKFSYWNGKRLSYVEARKQIYIPIYAKSVVGTEAFYRLQRAFKKNDLALFDFDGYLTEPFIDLRQFNGIVNNPKMKMGHGFVLAMLLIADGDVTKLRRIL
jgi:hypothetical protein